MRAWVTEVEVSELLKRWAGRREVLLSAGRRVPCSAAAVAAAIAIMAAGSHGWEVAHGQAGAQTYALVDTWAVPETTLTWPVRAVDVAIGYYQREIYVVDAEPPRVLVLAPDGGTLRTIGAELLEAPGAVAVRPGADVGDPRQARLYVAEPSLGRLQVFSGRGDHVRTVIGLGSPVAITAAREGVFVADPAGDRIVVLDGNGDRLGEWTGMGDPVALVATDNYRSPDLAVSLVVADGDGRRLTWLGPTGGRLDSAVIAPEGQALRPLDISLVDHENEDEVYIATERGLVRMRRSGGSFDSTVIEGLDVNGIVAVAAYRIEGQDWQEPDGWSMLYIATDGESRLHRFYYSIVGGTSRELQQACPWVDEEPRPSQPWRLAVDSAGRVYVANSDGVLVRYDDQGKAARLAEMGDIDDFAVTDDGRLYLNTRSEFVHVGADSQVLETGFGNQIDGRTSWWQEYDCTPAGYGMQGSLSATPDGRAVDVLHTGTLQREASERASTYQVHAERRDAPPQQPWASARLFWPEVNPFVPRPWSWWHLLTDVASWDGGSGALVVHRVEGRVYPIRDLLQFGSAPDKPWPIPGRPTRIAVGSDSVFVLTAEGTIWQLDATGIVLSGWDAGGAPNDMRAELIDVAAAGDRVYALDRVGRRVLVFEPRGDRPPAPPPDVPPLCSVSTDKNASEDDVALHTPFTVTLQLEGTCGRSGADSDILLLVAPHASQWASDNYQQASEVLLNAVDFSRDRVAVMVLDATGEVTTPFTRDAGAVRAALAAVLMRDAHYDRDVHGLDLARAYVEANARPDSNRVVVVSSAVYGTVFGTTMAAQRMRQAGIRTIVVTEDLNWYAAAMAYQPEDVFIAPDAATLREVYAQLGRQLAARVLARELTVTDAVPDNMEYVTDSANPPGAWNAAERTLTWRTSGVSFAGWKATYSLMPQQLGYWPTNVSAAAEFIDGMGSHGRASFPVPWVRVVVPPTPTPTPTPTATETPTATPSRVPTQGPRAWTAYLPLAVGEACDRDATSSDVVLVIDASTSMDQPTANGGTKLAAACEAARILLGMLRLGSGDQAAVVWFNSSAAVSERLTGDRQALERALADIETASQSRLDRGISAAHAELVGERSRYGSQRVIVLLTDGQVTPVPINDAVRRAEDAKAAGVIIFSVGLGDTVETDALQTIASHPDYYYHAPDAETLQEIYRKIALMIPCSSGRYWPHGASEPASVHSGRRR